MDSEDIVYEVLDQLDPQSILRFCETLDGKGANQCDEQFWRHQLRKHYGGVTLDEITDLGINSVKRGTKIIDIRSSKRLFEVLTNLYKLHQDENRNLLSLFVHYKGIDIRLIKYAQTPLDGYLYDEISAYDIRGFIENSRWYLFFFTSPSRNSGEPLFWDTYVDRNKRYISGHMIDHPYVHMVVDLIRKYGTRSWWKEGYKTPLPNKYKHLMHLITGGTTDKMDIMNELLKYRGEINELKKYFPIDSDTDINKALERIYR